MIARHNPSGIVARNLDSLNRSGILNQTNSNQFSKISERDAAEEYTKEKSRFGLTGQNEVTVDKIREMPSLNNSSKEKRSPGEGVTEEDTSHQEIEEILRNDISKANSSKTPPI